MILSFILFINFFTFFSFSQDSNITGLGIERNDKLLMQPKIYFNGNNYFKIKGYNIFYDVEGKYTIFNKFELRLEKLAPFKIKRLIYNVKMNCYDNIIVKFTPSNSFDKDKPSAIDVLLYSSGKINHYLNLKEIHFSIKCFEAIMNNKTITFGKCDDNINQGKIISNKLISKIE